MSHERAGEGSTTYVCTVSKTCGSAFRDYPEWCHHEAVEHRRRFDLWYCEEAPGTGPRTCSWGFYAKEQFMAHRTRDHDDPGCHADCHLLGPTLGEFFYCGFCRASYPTECVEWWRARAGHLKAHFQAGNTVADWVHIEMH